MVMHLPVRTPSLITDKSFHLGSLVMVPSVRCKTLVLATSTMGGVCKADWLHRNSLFFIYFTYIRRAELEEERVET